MTWSQEPHPMPERIRAFGLELRRRPIPADVLSAWVSPDAAPGGMQATLSHRPGRAVPWVAELERAGATPGTETLVVRAEGHTAASAISRAEALLAVRSEQDGYSRDLAGARAAAERDAWMHDGMEDVPA